MNVHLKTFLFYFIFEDVMKMMMMKKKKNKGWKLFIWIFWINYLICFHCAALWVKINELGAAFIDEEIGLWL
jgi:hypothetical protein